VKRTKEKISRLIFYSPFLLTAFILVVVSISTLFYNQNEFTSNTTFLAQEMERLEKSGVSEEIINDSLYRFTEKSIQNTQNRTLYGFSVAFGAILISALFIFTVFS